MVVCGQTRTNLTTCAMRVFPRSRAKSPAPRLQRRTHKESITKVMITQYIVAVNIEPHILCSQYQLLYIPCPLSKYGIYDILLVEFATNLCWAGDYMASLTHVCMWSEHGWIHVTAAEAARLHPGGTVSAKSGLFMCDLCGQYVILTDGQERDRYFKHSAYESSKDCPERTFGPGYTVPRVQGEHELPIRIKIISSSDFALELGLLYIPSALLNNIPEKQIVIKPSGQSSSYVYTFERLNQDCITYLSIGSVPAPSYELKTAQALQTFWPKVVKGVDQDGAVFEARTGRKLPNDADVIVGEKYYYLCKQKMYRAFDGVAYHLICAKAIKWSNWYIYEIEATNYTMDAAKFFLSLHCRLTDTPISIQPIWPPYAQTPFVIKHDQNELYVHITGQSGLATSLFPSSRMRSLQRKEESILYEIACTQRQHLVSVGRTRTLQYTYLWKENLDQVAPTPQVTAVDCKGEIVQPGSTSTLPAGRAVTIRTPFDGTIICSHQDKIYERKRIRAEVPTRAEDLKMGTEVAVLQGLDRVWSISFQKRVLQKSPDKSDDQVLHDLKAYHGQKIKIDHRAGAMAGLLSAYPKAKIWLWRQIRAGAIDQEALKYLRGLTATSEK